MIREPQSAIAAFAVHYQCNLANAIEEYIGYYSPLLAYLKDCIIVDFNEVTKDLAAVVEKINSRTGLCLYVPTASDEFLSAVTRSIESLPWGKDPMTRSLPNRQRTAIIMSLREKLSGSMYKSRMATAERLYAQCTSQIVN